MKNLIAKNIATCLLLLAGAGAVSAQNALSVITCDGDRIKAQDLIALQALHHKPGPNAGPLRTGGVCLRNLSVHTMASALFVTGEICDDSAHKLIDHLSARWGPALAQARAAAYVNTPRTVFHLFPGKAGNPTNPVRNMDPASKSSAFWCMTSLKTGTQTDAPGQINHQTKELQP